MAKEKDQNGRKYWQFFWRSWAIQDSWNYERARNMVSYTGLHQHWTVSTRIQRMKT